MENIPGKTLEQRRQQLHCWLAELAAAYKLDLTTVVKASADASFRSYYRIFTTVGGSYVIMDAPPELEDVTPFVQVQQLFFAAGVRVPKIVAQQAELGFLLLEDVGQATLLQHLQHTLPAPAAEIDFLAVRGYFEQALEQLIKLQQVKNPHQLPTYSAAKLLAEMQLFVSWYLERYLGIVLTAAQQQLWQQQVELIAGVNLQAPLVAVHRDFMPRNLMVTPSGELAVIDFQDAVYGPVTYDIASLMKDAFISWDEQAVLDITVRYWQQARDARLLNYADWQTDFAAFYRAVEWMALQRHLKVAGIFARLSLRDGKEQYLTDTPRFINYICHTCSRYHELHPLLKLLRQLKVAQVSEAFSFGRC